jgi:peptide/nickel transport system permease protein
MGRRGILRKAVGTPFVRFIARRALLSVFVVFGVVVVTFFLSTVVPADPAALWAGPHASPEDIARAREKFHLNDPVPVRFYYYVAALVTGDLGTSLATHRPVATDLVDFLPATLELILAAMVLAVLVGIPLGVFAGIRQRSWADHLVRLLAVGGVSLPAFWLAVLLELVFVSQLGWLPVEGRFSDTLAIATGFREITGFVLLDALLQGNLAIFFDGFFHLVLPAVTLASYPVGLVARMVRTMMIEVLGENYIRTARAYGLPARLIHYRYALKNAIAPAIVALGLSFAFSLTGAFLIENIFSWNGLGQYAWDSSIASDYPAILGVALVVAIIYVIVNMVVDIVQSVLDPRVALAREAS